eukprot:XP_988365.1 PREDICTED: uncharacterized protein Gm7160 [Mus musculus]
MLQGSGTSRAVLMLDGFQQTEDVGLGLSDHGEDKTELNPKSASVIKPRDGELLSTFYIDKRVPGAEEPEEQGLESSGTGITNVCEQSHGYWNQSLIFWKTHPVLLNP